jgi:hypothetical protein
VPRTPRTPKASGSTRRWRYLGDTTRVLADVRHVTGSTLLAHPGGVYELHTDHDVDDFGHPLLEQTDAEACDPAFVEPAEQTDPPTDPDPSDQDGDSEES